MSEKPRVAQDGPKKPSANAATSPAKKAIKKVAAPDAKKQPAPVNIDGKIVRNDPPPAPIGRDTLKGEMPAPAQTVEGKVDGTEDGITRPIGTETIANDPPAQPAPKLRRPAEDAGAEKAASMLGDYKLLKKLGQGGMGAVYKAEQISEKRIVAIKVLSKDLVGKSNFVERFKREARAMQKLDHPNILRCYDVGEAKGFHYLTMEIVDGGSVENWLKKLGKFSVGDALHIILKTCYALQHAHDKTIIHRDVKPDNILLTKEGVIKIADLGLAKDTDEDVSLTKTGAGAGTPIYMAPEQARDVKHVDVRVDIYAIGVMMYVFMTGQAPFQGNTLVELIAAKEKGKFDPMRRHNSEVPPKLDLIVDKMLSKDPKMRFASCQEVIDQLEPLGLANEELTFIAADKEPPAPAVTKKPAGPTKTPSAPAGKTAGPKPAAKTTAPTSKGPPEQTSIEDEEPERDVWYWNMITQEGKKINKKLSTEQVKALIKAGRINAQAEISKTLKGDYRAAGTFMEFQGAFKALETATKANVKGASYKSQMQQLQDDYDRQKKWGGVSRFFKGVGGTIFGLFWIILILAGVGIGGYFLWTKVLNP